MQRYRKNKDGLPLIPFVPEAKDRIPVPLFPDYLEQEQHECTPSWANSTITHTYCGHTSEQLKELIEECTPLMEEWRQKALAAGFEDAYLILDINNGEFWPVYERLPAIHEVVQIKAEARQELRIRDRLIERANKRYKEAQDLLGEEE